jgi:hypothetical protein
MLKKKRKEEKNAQEKQNKMREWLEKKIEISE